MQIKVISSYYTSNILEFEKAVNEAIEKIEENNKIQKISHVATHTNLITIIEYTDYGEDFDDLPG